MSLFDKFWRNHILLERFLRNKCVLKFKDRQFLVLRKTFPFSEKLNLILGVITLIHYNIITFWVLFWVLLLKGNITYLIKVLLLIMKLNFTCLEEMYVLLSKQKFPITSRRKCKYYINLKKVLDYHVFMRECL